MTASGLRDILINLHRIRITYQDHKIRSLEGSIAYVILIRLSFVYIDT